MTHKIKEQILAIRDTSLTNMFDLSMVNKIASEMGFHELIAFIEEYEEEYIRFIFTGK
ncbi:MULTISPECIES: DUF5049 domain-containing protein [Clostridium]|uniref:DUF5049 domain-containing protein n=2 Tax=Clostridium TaxID=1485 RepID=A0A381J8W8_9CLOT|nr:MULTISPECIES: DUF5049 domain-containing protein [Clostridium]MBB6630668.1 DUF5049 domain-containing protein [Clostridium algidicarnis]PPK44975.1 uncharacterized protein DUF5049 [Clostridium algidicarnis DSM 15099]SUY47710.1 Uncharacterised protein [Clostridium putrefaciens]